MSDRTTYKQIEHNAKSLGLKLDRLPGYINIRKTSNSLYTAQSTQEAYAFLQGYRACVVEIVNKNTTAEQIWDIGKQTA